MLAIWGPKLAGFLAALAVAWAAQHNLTLSETEVTAIFVAVFKFLDVLLSRYLNPGNVSAPELVEEHKVEARALRAQKRARRARPHG